MNKLENARKEINHIDKEIVELFEKRMKAVIDVIAYKKENGLPILDQGREAEVLNRVSSYLENKELEKYIRELYQTMMKVSKEYQHEL